MPLSALRHESKAQGGCPSDRSPLSKHVRQYVLDHVRGRLHEQDVPADLDELARHLATDSSLPAVAASSSPTGALGLEFGRHDPVASVLYLLAARRAVVDEPGGTGGPVAIVPGVPSEWFGAAMEAHAMPVTGGAVAFGLRWHGERPAVLWDLATAAPTSVCAPSLDAAWSDERPRAEALLGVTAGLELDEAPRGPEPGQGISIEVDDDPDSFA